MGLLDDAVYDLLGRLTLESVYFFRLSKRQSEMTGNFVCHLAVVLCEVQGAEGWTEEIPGDCD